MRRRENQLPLLAGWLFADLLLAFGVIVLGASSGDPAVASTPETTTTTTTTTPPAGDGAPATTTTTTVMPAGIAADPVIFQPDADFAVLMGPDGPAREAERTRIRAQVRQFFADRMASSSRAGFVLTFGIHPQVGVGQRIAAEYNRLLQEAAPEVFSSARMRVFDSRASARQGGANIEVYFLT